MNIVVFRNTVGWRTGEGEALDVTDTTENNIYYLTDENYYTHIYLECRKTQ